MDSPGPPLLPVETEDEGCGAQDSEHRGHTDHGDCPGPGPRAPVTRVRPVLMAEVGVIRVLITRERGGVSELADNIHFLPCHA